MAMRKAIRSTSRAWQGKTLLTSRPVSPCRVKGNGLFITLPAGVVKPSGFSFGPNASPSCFSSAGL